MDKHRDEQISSSDSVKDETKFKEQHEGSSGQSRGDVHSSERKTVLSKEDERQLKALTMKKPNQHVINILSDLERWKTFTETLQMGITADNDSHFKASYLNLVELTHPNELADYLWQDGVLNYEQCERVRGKPTKKEAMREILNHCVLSEHGYYGFLRAYHLYNQTCNLQGVMKPSPMPQQTTDDHNWPGSGAWPECERTIPLTQHNAAAGQPRGTGTGPECREREIELIYQHTGLDRNSQSKLRMNDVMCIRHNSAQRSKQSLALTFLRKLVLVDCRGRDDVNIQLERTGTQNTKCAHNILDVFASECSTYNLNPLDVLLTVYNSCHLILRQLLVQKMFMCKLAIPLLYPTLFNDELQFPLWVLSSLVFEYCCKDADPIEVTAENHSMPIVSFVRRGTLSISKSKLLNGLLNNDCHNTFFNRDCQNGHSERKVAGGLVECSWYLPSGTNTDNFEDITMFLNLRGDSIVHEKQRLFIEKVSTVVVHFVPVSHLEDNESIAILVEMLKRLMSVVIVFTGSIPFDRFHKAITSYHQRVDSIDISTHVRYILEYPASGKMNVHGLIKSIRAKVNELLVLTPKRTNVVDMCQEAVEIIHLTVDKDNPDCTKGTELAETMSRHVEDYDSSYIKKDCLPLQGEPWHKYGRLLRQMAKGRSKEGETIPMATKIDNLQQEMKEMRNKQLEMCKNLSPFVKNFIDVLTQRSNDGDVTLFFLQWLKILLDNRSRKNLPRLRKTYCTVWQRLKDTSGMKHEDSKFKALQSRASDVETELIDASLGVENLLREIAQLYEACHDSESYPMEYIRNLPHVAAKLMLEGHPLEIMDGDACNVPTTWLNAVLESVKEMIRDKKLFVLSVLGIQGTGKSTLLNCMFGMQFAVSAGRCTKGVFAQMVKVEENSTLPFDFMIILDTEGLHAPELALGMHNRDNEIATLIIGLGDMTLINIKGENTTEIRNVLQTVAHAFLRRYVFQKQPAFRRTCVFVHQNVSAVNAMERNAPGQHMLLEALDKMTVEAAEQEQISGISKFQQVIDFGCDKNVWYVSDLWHGDPPMAPVNIGYSERLSDMKKHIIDCIQEKGNEHRYLDITNTISKIGDLWKGIIGDDFVFSFKNSLETKAYRSLDSKMRRLTLELDSLLMDWRTKTAEIEIEGCRLESKLQKCHISLEIKLLDAVAKKELELIKKLEAYFDESDLKSILIQWKGAQITEVKNMCKIRLTATKGELLEMTERKKLDIKCWDELNKHESFIMKKAKEEAAKVKRGDTVEQNKSTFDLWWMSIETEFGKEEKHCAKDISTMTEVILREVFGHENQSTLTQELSNSTLGMWNASNTMFESFPITKYMNYTHISIPQTTNMVSLVLQCVPRVPYLGQTAKGRNPDAAKNTMFEERQSTVSNEIKFLFDDIETYINDVSSQDQSFQQGHARYVIEKVIEFVDCHNKEPIGEQDFHFLDPLKVKLSCHAASYAVHKFKIMQEEYDKTHSVAAKLKKFKVKAWNLFKNTFEMASEEITAADFLCDTLQGLITRDVYTHISTPAVTSVLGTFDTKKKKVPTATLR